MEKISNRSIGSIEETISFNKAYGFSGSYLNKLNQIISYGKKT